jgi:hypothetical protein
MRFIYRFLIFLVRVLGIITVSYLKQMFNKVKKHQRHRMRLIQPISRQINHINRHNLRYRIKIIISTYLIALTNSILFESMTFVPLGWLLNGIIVVIMEDFCLCLRKMVPRLFKEPSDTISTYRLLFKTRHVVNAVLTWSIAALCVLGNVGIYVLKYIYV